MVKMLRIQNRDRLFWLGAIAIVLTGLALRLFAARGDLTQDEITTLYLLGKIHRADQIFWDINHDNNHYLNSLYLYLIGDDASVFAQRLLSVIMGTLTIVAVGLAQWRRGRLSSLIAMLFFALSYEMVNYDSLARGYAGLMLFTVMALYYLEEILAGKNRAWHLGALTLLGILSHPNMAFSLIAFILYACGVEIGRLKSLERAVDKTLEIFAPSFLLLSPVIFWTGFIVATHRFRFGGFSGFHLNDLLGGYGLSIQGALSLAALHNPYVYLAMAGCAATGSLILWKKDTRQLFYVAALIATPAVMAICQMPNSDQPRYFLGLDLALLLLVSDALARGWLDGKTIQRSVVLSALFFILTSNYIVLQNFWGWHR